MSTGILAATWLCLAIGQAPSGTETVHYNIRALRIPAPLPASMRNDVRELLLFASPDQGRTWPQADRITPEKPGFAFYAPRDGVYWLRLAYVNKAGVQSPDDRAIMQGPPNMVLIIDTLKPIMRSLDVQRDGPDVNVKWDVQEDHPDRAGIVLAYQVKDGLDEKWTVVPVPTPALQGTARFRPANGQAITIRLTVRDLAKNESYAERVVESAVTAAGFSEPPPVVVQPGKTDVPSLPIELQMPHRPMEPLKMGPPPGLPAPPGVAPIPHKVQSIVRPAQFGEGGTGEKVIADSRLPEPPRQVGPGPMMPQPGMMQPPPLEKSPLPLPARKTLPDIRHVNKHVVALQYEFKRIGPSGVGGLQIWLTRDDGANWKPFAEVKDVQNEVTVGRQEKTFEFRDEHDMPFPDGVYGLKLVVKNRAGLGHTPKAGDAPDIRVEIDTRFPVAQLYKPRPDPQRPDHVLLKWFADDKNLTERPITLEYAEKRDGPWLPIQSDIENRGRFASREVSGDYSWKVPPGCPVQVYLRLRVRDQAGNESVAISSSPEFLDLTEPEGALIGVHVK